MENLTNLKFLKYNKKIDWKKLYSYVRTENLIRLVYFRKKEAK